MDLRRAVAAWGRGCAQGLPGRTAASAGPDWTREAHRENLLPLRRTSRTGKEERQPEAGPGPSLAEPRQSARGPRAGAAWLATAPALGQGGAWRGAVLRRWRERLAGPLRAGNRPGPRVPAVRPLREAPPRAQAPLGTRDPGTPAYPARRQAAEGGRGAGRGGLAGPGAGLSGRTAPARPGLAPPAPPAPRVTPPDRLRLRARPGRRASSARAPRPLRCGSAPAPRPAPGSLRRAAAMRLRARGPRAAPGSSAASSVGAGDVRRLAPPGRNPFVHELRLSALRKAQVGARPGPGPAPPAPPPPRGPRPPPTAPRRAASPPSGARALAPGPTPPFPDPRVAAPAVPGPRVRSGRAQAPGGNRAAVLDVTWSLDELRVGTSSVL